MALMVLIMVFLSGLTGLVYQVTWQKYLSVYLGSHALSTSLTLSCFFLFLAMGYSFFGRFGHLLGSNRIKSYAYIEGLIGVYAIISPDVFSFLYEKWPSYPSDSLSHFFSSVGFAFLLMGFPTFLMGGTIPLLTQGMSKQLQESHKVHAWVYGLNTLGAFLGTLATGFLVLEVLGLAQSLNITGFLNCLICVFLIVYCKISRQSFEGYIPAQKSETKTTQAPLLFIAFLSGVLAFGLESLCIRMAGISLGSSNYTYTVIVSSFIVSIAIGSMLAAKASETNGLRWLLGTQLGLLVSLMGLSMIIPNWADVFMKTRLMFATSEITFTPYWMTVLVELFIMLVVPVTLMGMTLPLLFQQLKRQGVFLNQTAGKMYSWNSIGAATGAICLGYLAFFFMNAHQVFLVLIMISALSCFLLFRISTQGYQGFKTYLPLALGLIYIVISPGWGDYNFVPSRFFRPSFEIPTFEAYRDMIDLFNKDAIEKESKIIYSNYGVNTYTVVTEGSNGERAVFVNGKPDASTEGDRFTRTLTALIPLSLAEKNEDIFIVGLGAGMSTGIAASFEGNKSVRVCEIAAGVIKSLPFFEKWNFNLKDNMQKVEIINDDAYKVLKNETKTYDLIFSEPSNTWVTGVEKIYTREFLSQAAKKLRPHGIYSQWFPLFAMSEQAFLSILYNFKSTFSNVTLWSAGGGATIIVASHQPLKVDLEKVKEKFIKMKNIYTSIKREAYTDILYHQLLSDPAITELAKKSKIAHSLYHPTLAYQTGRALFANTNVSLHKLATETFAGPKNKENETSDQVPFRAQGEDSLFWQTFQDQLPKDFFDRGNEFLIKQHSLVAGKLSLAKSYRFPIKKDQNVDRVFEQTQTKINQYHYLQSENPQMPPKRVNSTDDLGSELFDRYLYLLSMREKAYLRNVTSNIPDQCSPEEIPCFQGKLKILRYEDKINRVQFGNWRGQLKDIEVQKTIENLYKTSL